MVKQFLLVFAIVVVALPIVISGTEFVVGDGDGWTTSYDYEGWAKGKEFWVGDKLVFKYTIGSHNVYQVNEDDYKKCNIPHTESLSSGTDIITLDSPGIKYFVCGVGLHCLEGAQKLAVDVKQRGPHGLTNKSTTTQSPAPIGYGLTLESSDADHQLLAAKSTPAAVVAADVSTRTKSNEDGV